MAAGCMFYFGLNRYNEQPECPVFSQAGGVFSEEFYLEISVPDDKDASIFYTLNGSKPEIGKASDYTFEYSGPILIQDVTTKPAVLSSRTDLSVKDYSPCEEDVTKANIIRAVSVDSRGRISEEACGTYLVTDDKDIIDAHRRTGILSIMADTKDLIDSKTGIMVTGDVYSQFIQNHPEAVDYKYDFLVEANFTQRGSLWQRDCVAQFIPAMDIKHNSGGFFQAFGIRNRGVAGSDGPKKAYNLYALDNRGEETYMSHNPFSEFFDNFNTSKAENISNHRYKGLMLKNYQCYLRDGFISSLISSDIIPAVDYAPYNVYINGEYWGVYCLLERYDTTFFANHFSVPEKDVVIVKNGESQTATNEELQELMDIIKADTFPDYSVHENLESLKQKIDLDSFLDYYCIQLFIDNLDFDETYNCIMWKTRNKSDTKNCDGRWRWVLYDIDSCLIDLSQDNVNYDLMEGRISPIEHPLFKALMQNESFRANFIKRMEYYSYEILGAPENDQRIEDLRVVIKDSVDQNNIRYGIDSDFRKEVKNIQGFFTSRSYYLAPYINTYMEKMGFEERMITSDEYKELKIMSELENSSEE